MVSASGLSEVINRTFASLSRRNARSTRRSSTAAASAALARRGEIAVARSRTDVPAATERVDPSGRVMVTSLIARNRDFAWGVTAWRLGQSAPLKLRRDSLRAGLPSRSLLAAIKRRLVGAGGLEPLTSSVSGRRSNQLSYAPICCGFRR